MVAVIVNPIAGGARPHTARRRVEIAREVLDRSSETFEIFVTERKGHARALAAAAASRGARLVVAWGGDGTVNEVATSLVGREAVLGIVPAGSGNGLARELGISPEPGRAMAGAVAGRARTIDAGELAGRLFFNIAGIGFDAHVAACFDRDLAGRRGFAGYVRISARELIRYRSRTYRIALGEEPGRPDVELEAAGHGALRRAFVVTLANSGQWGNGARIAPSALVDDGRLDLVVVEERSRLATICAVPRVFTGTIGRARGVSIRRIERAVIESEEPMLFHVDGEVVEGGCRLEGRVRPAVLNVAVP